MLRLICGLVFATVLFQYPFANAASDLCKSGFPKVKSIPDNFNYEDWEAEEAPLSFQSQRVYFSSDESRMFASKYKKSIAVYETVNWEKIGSLVTPELITRTTYNGDRLAVGLINGQSLVYNLEGQLIFSNTRQNSEPVGAIQLSPSGRYLIVSTGAYDTSLTRVFDLNSSEEIYTDTSPFNFNFLYNQRSFIFSEDEQFLIHIVWSWVDPTLLVKNLQTGDVYSATFPKEDSYHNSIDQMWVQPGTGKFVLRVESGYHSEGSGDVRLHWTAQFDPVTGLFSSIVKSTQDVIYNMSYAPLDPMNLWVLNQQTYNQQDPISFYKVNIQTGEKTNSLTLPMVAFEKSIIRPFDNFLIVAGAKAAMFYGGYVFDMEAGSEVGFIFDQDLPIIGKSRRYAVANTLYDDGNSVVADISCLND